MSEPAAVLTANDKFNIMIAIAGGHGFKGYSCKSGLELWGNFRPCQKGNVLLLIHSKGQVLGEEYTAEGTQVDCLVDATLYQRVMSMLK